jgi:hypothetical protein
MDTDSLGLQVEHKAVDTLQHLQQPKPLHVGIQRISQGKGIKLKITVVLLVLIHHDSAKLKMPYWEHHDMFGNV